jgi:hypothetical protein
MQGKEKIYCVKAARIVDSPGHCLLDHPLYRGAIYELGQI